MNSIKHWVGIIGLDHWYWTYPIAGSIVTRKDTAIKWICSGNEKQARDTAGLFGVQKYTIDYNDVLADPAIDIVIITPATNMHDEIAVAAAKAGKHILLGKPISRTLCGADAIVRAIKESGVKAVGLAAGPDPADPVYQLIKKSVIGTPYAAASSCRACTPLKAPGVREPGWFVEIDHAAGGAFLDHAIYAATRFELLFNSRVKSVYAQLAKMVHKEWELEDYGVAMLRYENGAIATIESTFGATDFTISTLLVTGTEGEIWETDDNIRIAGSKPEYKAPVIYKKQPRNWFYNTIDNYKNSLSGQSAFGEALFLDLLRTIDEGYETLNTVENARNGLEICLAAYKSADIGKPVELPLTEEVNVKDILSRIS